MTKNRIRHRRAGHRVEHLLEQAEPAEAHERGHVLGLAVVAELLGDGVEHRAVVELHAVHRQHHAAHRGHALVGGVELQHAGLAGLGERHGVVLQLIGRRAEVDRRRRRAASSATGVADAAAGHHRGDVGDAEQLRRHAVGTGAAGRARPRCRWRPGRRPRVCSRPRIVVVGHDGALGVHLQDERLRAVVGGAVDGVRHRLHLHLVEQARHLQHVDRREVVGDGPSSEAGRWCRTMTVTAVDVRRHRCVACAVDAEQRQPCQAREGREKKGDR